MFGKVKITRDPSGYDPANPTSDPTLETACSCCRRCGATVPCETAAAGECVGRCFCGVPDDESAEPSGVETVRAEMTARGDAAYCQGRDVIAFAARLYATHANVFASHYKSTDPTPWTELSAVTVRAWVAVARESVKS